MGGKHHVVCHECPEERVLEDGDAARAVQSAHEEETGHRMSRQEIEVPAAVA